MESNNSQGQAAIDAPRVAELIGLVGAARLGALIDLLEARLNRIMTGIAATYGTDKLGEAIHQSRGSASCLGFTRLAQTLGLAECLMHEAPGAAAGAAGPLHQAQIASTLRQALAELAAARRQALG